MLRHVFRIAVSATVLILGLVPSFLLFFWVERNMALPFVGPWLIENLGPYGSWPLVFLDTDLTGWIFFDVLLVVFFGAVHSGFAAFRSPRPLFVVATGLSSIFLLVLWQPTGILLYQLIPSALISAIVSSVIYWSLLLGAAFFISRFESPFSFVGLSARPNEDDIPFQPRGPYAIVRHPAYALTILAWFVTPMLSLDRLVFGLAMSAYLLVGIRLEEKRLEKRFGEKYRDYRKNVPMLIPRFSASRVFESWKTLGSSRR